MNQRLLRTFLKAYPFQPATAIWRTSEVSALARIRLPEGLGLDLGCGDGRLSRILADESGGLRLVGLDVDPQETELAKNERLYERVHTSTAEHIAEPDACFDFVLSISVMEHIPKLEPVLAEVARVVKPGGLLVVTVPAIGFHSCLRGPWLFGSSRDRYLSNLDRRVAHLRYWSAVQWRDSLMAAGFHSTEVTPIMSSRVIRRWETISRLTAGLLHLATRRKAPIEIQRSLGLRKPGRRMPTPFAALLAPLLSVGVSDTAPHDEATAGCVLILARR